MARHVDIRPHAGKHEHVKEIVRKLEDHLGLRSHPIEGGHRFELDEDDPERNAANFSGALDTVAPDWRNHLEMGL